MKNWKRQIELCATLIFMAPQFATSIVGRSIMPYSSNETGVSGKTDDKFVMPYQAYADGHKAIEAYQDDTVNPGTTTSDMAEWSARKTKEYKQHTKNYSHKLKQLPLKPALRHCIEQEMACWDELATALNAYDALAIKLTFYEGGSMEYIEKEGCPQDIAFFRMACIKEDYALMKLQKKQVVPDINLRHTGILQSMRKELNSLEAQSHDAFFIENVHTYGSLAKYRLLLKKARRQSTQVDAILTKWVNQRCRTEKQLPFHKQKSYRYHTHKVLMSLVNHFTIDRFS